MPANDPQPGEVWEYSAHLGSRGFPVIVTNNKANNDNDRVDVNYVEQGGKGFYVTHFSKGYFLRHFRYAFTFNIEELERQLIKMYPKEENE